MKTVQSGGTGLTVQILQYLIDVEADGNFGPKTELALIDFKKSHGLPANGVCDGPTWTALAAVQPLLKLGSTGAAKALQLILGIPVSPAGLFGPVTLAALTRLQTAAGLLPPGQCGPKTWAYLLTQYELPIDPVKPVDYKQYDKRWAKNPFGNGGGTIKNSGCGATAMANVLATWFDKNITPATVTEMENEQGYATPHSGTARAFFDWVAKKYGFSQFKRTYSTDEVIAALKGGAYVVALMGQGYWTRGGHYICCWKYEPATDRIYACDPASATRKSAVSKVFRGQRKEYFIFFK